LILSSLSSAFGTLLRSAPERLVGLRPTDDRKCKLVARTVSVGLKDGHPSRGYLTLLQGSVRHSIEPVCAFVFEDNAASGIEAIVGASDSELLLMAVW